MYQRRRQSTRRCVEEVLVMRQNISPTIAGPMKNDEIIGAGHRAFAKVAHDQAGNSS
jgi:hypothetical protein